MDNDSDAARLFVCLFVRDTISHVTTPVMLKPVFLKHGFDGR